MAKRDTPHGQEVEQDAREAAVQLEDSAPEEQDKADEFEQLLLERDQLKDQLLRTAADFQNFRKRAAQERLQLQQFATEQLVSELLPVLDNFDRTIAALDTGATVESLIEGVKLVDKQLRTVLEGQQVRKIGAHGEAFDPDLHEAIETEEHPHLPEGTITSEVQAGYRMANKVIRPARVRVAKGKSDGKN